MPYYDQNPYYWAAPPYQQQQQMSGYNPYQQTQDRLRELEERYGNNNYGYANNSNYNNMRNSNSYGAQHPQVQIICQPVNTEDEAWRLAPQLDGSKQYFIDEVNECFYVKYFDASIPKTIKKIYRLTPDVIEEETDKENLDADMAEAINDLSIKLDDLVVLVEEVRKNVTGVTGSDLEMAIPKNTGQSDDIKQSDGDRTKGGKPRSSDGRFVSNSEK